MTARGKRFCCLSAIVVLVSLGLALLAFGDPGWMYVLVIPMWGTLFGQTSLAAGWCALGPFSLARRLAISSVWLAAIMLAFSCNRWNDHDFNDMHPVLTFSLMVLAEWLLVVVPIWAIAAWFQLRIQVDGEATAEVNQDRQIGVREAMILTATVAVVFGAARWRTGGLDGVSINWQGLRIYGIPTVEAAVVAVLPMTLWLFARSWFWSIVGAAILLTINTALELSVLFLLDRPIGFQWQFCLFVSLTNLTHVTWIGGVLSLLRLGGFRIVSGAASSNPVMPIEHAGKIVG